MTQAADKPATSEGGSMDDASQWEATSSDAPPADPAPPPASSAEVTRLRAELEQVKEQLDQARRHAAELDNQRKRLQRDRERELTDRQASILKGLLPVVDNFERAMASVATATDTASLRAGTEQIYRLFVDWLAKQSVTPIECVGQPYDPHLHDAVMHSPSSEHPEGKVALELEKGYQLGDRVLRHAKVGVSSGGPVDRKDEEPAGDGEPSEGTN